MLDPTKEFTGVHRPRCSRCSECQKSFHSNPRLKSRQKTCGQRECVLKHRVRYRRKYRQKNPEAEKEYRDKAKAGRGSGFWKSYRKNHPHSTERNRLNSKLRARLKRASLQRQLDIVQVIDPPGYFDLFCGFAMSQRSLIWECQAKCGL